MPLLTPLPLTRCADAGGTMQHAIRARAGEQSLARLFLSFSDDVIVDKLPHLLSTKAVRAAWMALAVLTICAFCVIYWFCLRICRRNAYNTCHEKKSSTYYGR